MIYTLLLHVGKQKQASISIKASNESFNLTPKLYSKEYMNNSFTFCFAAVCNVVIFLGKSALNRYCNTSTQ